MPSIRDTFEARVGTVYRVKLQRPCSKPKVYDSMLLNNAFGIFQQLKRGLENE